MPRKPKRYLHIDKVEADLVVKKRLRMVLETLSGETKTQDAIRELGISETYFHKLRDRALAGAAQALTPARPGRKPKPKPAADVVRLEAKVAKLELQLQVEQLRHELELAVPGMTGRAAEKKRNRGSQAS